MPRTPWFRGLLALTPLLFSSPLPAQGAWSKAPALPRACYKGQDTFEGDAAKAITELESAIESQEQINRSINDQVMNMDPATRQQRMMAAIQKDPARANEIMQALGSPATDPVGAGAAAEVEENDYAARKLQLKVDYEAEWRSLGPVDLASPAALAQRNNHYETVLCPEWFGRQVPELLASYRTYLREQRIPRQAEGERSVLQVYELFGVPAKDFRPVAEMRGVLDYVRFAADLYAMRSDKPFGRP